MALKNQLQQRRPPYAADASLVTPNVGLEGMVNKDMALHIICNSVDMASAEWRKYCLWRNFDFRAFDSLDSTIHNSLFEILDDDDWKYAVTTDNFLTDIVNNFDFAKTYCERCGSNEILNFDFVENEDSSKQVIGYDILDGAFHYSLLTNFGNDIAIVNGCLGNNGLIRDKAQIIGVHRWFMDNMGNDHHVIGSRTFAVYEKYEHK